MNTPFMTVPMEPEKQIKQFLAVVRRKRATALAQNGAYLLLSLAGGAYLTANFLSYHWAEARPWWSPLFLPAPILLTLIFYRYFLRGALANVPADRSALWVEAKYPDLKNDLVNSCQLQRLLLEPGKESWVSFPFIREQVRRTALRIPELDADAVVDRRELARNRNLLLAVAGVGVLAFLALPDFIQRGYNNWFATPQNGAPTAQKTPQTPTTPPRPPVQHTLRDLTLTFTYPAYTRLASKTIAHADGAIQALPGTEVGVAAEIDPPAGSVNLVINGKERLAMSPAQSGTAPETRFIVREPGYYQFETRDGDDAPALLPGKKYAIALDKDFAPRIVLFVRNPKPVYYSDHKVELSYEAADDYGLQDIRLVASINGKTTKIPVKAVRDGAKELKENYTWNLVTLGLNPGDPVQYYLEALDNDNVSGPNIGHSTVYSFTVFDQRLERENLIQLHEELIEKMIHLLALALAGKEQVIKNPNADLQRLRKFVSVTTDKGIEIIALAQRIHEQGQTIPNFPASYSTLMKNIVTSLNTLREAELELLSKFSQAGTRSTGMNFPPVEPTIDKLIAHLERDLLFLIRMANREKMEQVTGLQKDSQDLAALLKKQFEKAKENRAAIPKPEIQANLEKLQKNLRSMMEQLAKQTQSLPDEFLNPEAFKHIDLENFKATLERIQELANQEKFSEALKEMEKFSEDLKTLAKQIEREKAAMDNMMDPQTQQQIEDSIKTLAQMEKEQRDILDATTKINQSLKSAQAKKFDTELKELFAVLKKEVNSAQSILDRTQDFIDTHPTTGKWNGLAEQEAQAERKIQELNQKALDAPAGKERENRFRDLHRARAELLELGREKDFLRMAAVLRFRTDLRKLLEQYDTLEQLAQAQDLTEFNSLFKNTFPEVLRQQNNLRATPNVKEDMAERIGGDLREVSEINRRISNKLGTLAHELQNDFPSHLSDSMRQNMEQMGEHEKRLGRESENLSESLTQMNQKNPMFGPELGQTLKSAGASLRRADEHLKKHDVQPSIDAENSALTRLMEALEALQKLQQANSAQGEQKQKEQTTLKLGKGKAQDPRKGGAVQMQKEQVDLPSQELFRVPGEFREDILDAMKNPYPKQYQRQVTEYYKELVK